MGKPLETPDFSALKEQYEHIDLEIGCGVGLHPLRYAIDNPLRYLVALEKTQMKFSKFQSRIVQHQLIPNLLAVHANAISWIAHSATQYIFSKCFILYPNPSPKNPACRWIKMPFMNRLIQAMKPGGSIEFATNEANYAEEIVKTSQDFTSLRLLTFEPIPNTFLPRTHFEKKYMARGEPCFKVLLEITKPSLEV